VRVSDSLVFESASRNIGKAREAAERAQDAASSGVRVEHPSDDAAAAGLIVAHQMSADRFTAISSATAAASDEIATSDSALDDVSTALSQARQLAVQFSNTTYSAEQRAAAAVEVDGLVTRIASSLNARVGNRYVFGGSKDDAPPFLADGSYAGDHRDREVEIAPGVTQQANVRADVALKGYDDATQTYDAQKDVFATLHALSAALQTNDVSGVQATLDGLQTGIDQVATARAQAGVSMDAFDAASSAAKTTSTQEVTSAGKLADVDLAQAAVALQASQTALQASYAATAQSFRLSILDYLK
jgi:flagellar hook-associated protein 3 FlgL